MAGRHPIVPVTRAAAPPRRAPALLALALLALVPGCNRKPHFVPAAADSALTVSRDSLAEQVRTLQQRWSAGGQGEEASRLTAELLLGDLRAHPEDGTSPAWEQRARALLDSLDVGAEFASGGCVLAVNFFARGDPAAGSWPWVYWCAPGKGGVTVQTQAVEGQGMGLIGAVARGLSGGPDSLARGHAPPGAPGIAALFARRSGGGQQPLVMVWRVGARLELVQTLGADSLGGVGTVAFETPGDSGVALTARTWRPTPHFDECATCPHVYHVRRFRWGLEGFQGVDDQIVPAPYVTFVDFIRALTAGDREGALHRVVQPSLVEAARRAGWATVKGSWRPAPGSEGSADEMVFYRGAGEAWKVRFARRGEDWLVESFEPTTRVIE
jgi:hypothetical protein